MKKIFLLLVFMAIAIGNACAYDFEVDGIYYNVVSLSDLTCEVTWKNYFENSYSGDIEIPSSVNYNGKTLSVVSIGSSAFYGCSSLTSISIPDGVTSIGYRAFGECRSLTFINIPDRITSIEENVFNNCSGLTSITIPNGVKYIGQCAFAGCSGLISLTIPDGVSTISEYAFYGCSGLTSITIGNGVTDMGRAFVGCNSLASVTIGNNCALSSFSSNTTIETITLAENYSDDFLCSILNSEILSKLIIKTSKKLTWEDSKPVTNKQYINLEVIVPADMLSYYQTADIWKDFWNLKSSDEDSETPEEPKTCKAPSITFDNDAKKLIFTSATDGAKYHCTIKSEDMMTEKSVDSELAMMGIYTITAYASADGMNNSEKTTAKLCWVSAAIESDDILTAKADRGVIVSSNGDQINISGTIGGETIESEFLIYLYYQ